MIDEPEETKSEIDLDSVPSPSPEVTNNKDTPTKEDIYNTLSSHQYASSYLHKPGAPTNPREIMKMDVPALVDMGRSVKADIQDIETEIPHGLYKNKRYKFLKSLKSFIRDVIKEKQKT